MNQIISRLYRLLRSELNDFIDRRNEQQPTPEQPPIDPLEDGTKTLLKYLNFLLPIILVVLYGLVRAQRRRRIRADRMLQG